MDAASVVVAVMDEWKAGIDAHDPGRVAAAFARDAVFQGLRPYGVGRAAVAAYYESQPSGMTVSYRVLESRTLATDAVIGYLRATFEFVDQPSLDLNIGVALARVGDEWLVAQYQASRV
ncbi:hypothetical protein H5P33_06890 [Mycolicibacterium arabiense]|nr:hypothetical protein [Mycolicibacterium arabiense]